MAGYTTTPDGDWVFNLEDPEPVLPSEVQGVEVPFYLQGEAWDNYVDDELYEMDCLIRAYFQDQIDNKVWGVYTPENKRVTSAKLVWERIYGEPYENTRKNQFRIRKIHRILDWYAIRSTTKYDAKQERTKGIYNVNPNLPTKKMGKEKRYYISVKRFQNCRPYSLKLRLQWLAEKEEIPNRQNMAVPKQVSAKDRGGTRREVDRGGRYKNPAAR